MTQLMKGVKFFIDAHRDENSEEVSTQRAEVLLLRAKCALDDAVKYAEEFFPDLIQTN